MAETGENILQVLKAIPPTKKISFALISILLLGGFITLILWTNRPDYQVLFSNLETGDASKISEKLNEKRIPFQLKDGGRAILVPDDMVYQLRLELAGDGIPTGSSVGFEIFNNISFGTTDFVQRLKFQQALQGELARTIMQFDSIDKARVHIVPAGNSLFAEPEKPATASVVIRPNTGKSLNQAQLQGIINLVACAVEGLNPNKVTVVDMTGGMLSKGQDENSISNISQTQFDYQRKLESTFEKRIQTMLEPVIGINKVVARVSADLDFRQVNISEEKYDPDSVVVRSEQKQKESSSDGTGQTSGSPDLKYQVYQNDEESTSSSSRRFAKENSVINYEINKVNTQIIDSTSDIKRLSASVIIDGPYIIEDGADGNPVQKFVPRSRKEMGTFEDIIKNAIGFNELRGDQVNVSNIAFGLQKEDVIFSETEQGWQTYVKDLSKPVLNVLLVLVFFIAAIKPFRKWLNQTGEYVNTMALQQREDALPETNMAELQMRQNSKQQLLDVTRKNPDAAAEIIKGWISEVS